MLADDYRECAKEAYDFTRGTKSQIKTLNSSLAYIKI